MIISIVVAVADNGVIGRDGRLPWRISADLKTFRRLTMGKPLIMGRKTFQSLKQPLDGRDNIVVTRNADFHPDGVIVAHSWRTALAQARRCAETRGTDEIMVIGGAGVFADALPFAERMYKTEVRGNPEGDARFPPIDWSEWQERSREALPRGPRDDCTATLVVLERKAFSRNFGGGA
jgi:dihydrofolate reductase